MSGGGARPIRAGVADGQEDGLPAAGGVAPVVRLQDERSLGAVSNHEAVDHVMELAAETAALVDVAHQLPRLAAVRRVLEGGKRGMKGSGATFLLLDLRLVSLKTPQSDLTWFILYLLPLLNWFHPLFCIFLMFLKYRFLFLILCCIFDGVLDLQKL